MGVRSLEWLRMHRRKRTPANIRNIGTRTNVTSGLTCGVSVEDAHCHAFRRVAASMRGAPTGDPRNETIQTKHRKCGRSAHSCPESTLQGHMFSNIRGPLAQRQRLTVHRSAVPDSLGTQPDRRSFPAKRGQSSRCRRRSPASIIGVSPCHRRCCRGCRRRSPASTGTMVKEHRRKAISWSRRRSPANSGNLRGTDGCRRCRDRIVTDE